VTPIHPMTPLQRNAERRQLTAKFREVLCEAATHRSERDDSADGPDGPEMGWAAYERGVMLGAVNIERAARGLSPVTEEDVLCAEKPGRGHSDYADQFAWGCTLLVTDHPADQDPAVEAAREA
jgi:hypothetical protein